jgi:hypothetical protein
MDIDHQPAGLPAWWAEFDQVVARAMATPFAWGRHDCVTFASACWKARTGVDALAGLGWSGELQAMRMVRERGGLRAAVTACLGEPCAPLLAARGDLVLAEDPEKVGHGLLAVCVGPHLVAPGRAGLSVLPLAAGVCAWRAA